jgi:hypothetical protein
MVFGVRLMSFTHHRTISTVYAIKWAGETFTTFGWAGK